MISRSRRTVVMGLAAAPVLAGSGMGLAFGASASPAPAIPSDLPHATFTDLRGWAAATTANKPVGDAARAAFARRKVLTALGNRAVGKDRRWLSASRIADRLGVPLPEVDERPVPGGVGFGFFFTDEFRTSWGSGTSLRFDIVCPLRPGGNVSDWLYLTATNRSTIGVEALVGYYAQNEPWFLIFDWALPGFVASIPLPSLADYLTGGSSDRALQALSIWNSTYSIGGGYYRNAVSLHNRLRASWDLVYQNDYPADDLGQKSGGGWGPIVETFQPTYAGTNPMGFRRTSFSQADASGAWSPWALLRPDQSTVRQDDTGHRVRDLNPNFGFMAVS